MIYFYIMRKTDVVFLLQNAAIAKVYFGEKLLKAGKDNDIRNKLFYHQRIVGGWARHGRIFCIIGKRA